MYFSLFYVLAYNVVIEKKKKKEKIEAATGTVLLKTYFAKFAGKRLYQGLIFNKILLKKETPTKEFSCKFCEIFKTTFIEEHLRLSYATLLRKGLRHMCFLVNFTKFLRSSFLQNGLFWCFSKSVCLRYVN